MRKQIREDYLNLISKIKGFTEWNEERMGARAYNCAYRLSFGGDQADDANSQKVNCRIRRPKLQVASGYAFDSKDRVYALHSDAQAEFICPPV
jgi:hypothetical protein